MNEIVQFTLVALSAVFFVVDPIAIVPIFITMTAGDSEEKRRSMARRACMITAGVLTFFALGGGLVFKLFGVTLAAFKIAGGVLLMMTALDMLRAAHHVATKTSDAEIAEGAAKADIAIVPLAMPLLAGPGAIATVMVLTAQSKRLWEIGPILFAIFFTAGISYLVLRAATVVNRILGQNGQAILSRVMGLMLAALSVQFMLNGLTEALPEVLAKWPKAGA